MLEWGDYIWMLLNQKCSFDNMRLYLNDIETHIIPPIIKASILMLDRMISAQGQYNIIVFPEKSQSLIIFALIKLLHNINEGKIQKAYNPESFVKGEKLKFKNCIIAFNRIEVHNGVPYLWVDNADCTVGAPIEMMPLLQRTNTNRKLSKDRDFSKAKKAARELLEDLPQNEKQLALLADYKTHMENSIFYVAPIIRTKEQLLGCRFNGKKSANFFLLSTIMRAKIRNIGADN